MTSQPRFSQQALQPSHTLTSEVTGFYRVYRSELVPVSCLPDSNLSYRTPKIKPRFRRLMRQIWCRIKGSPKTEVIAANDLIPLKLKGQKPRGGVSYPGPKQAFSTSE